MLCAKFPPVHTPLPKWQMNHSKASKCAAVLETESHTYQTVFQNNPHMLWSTVVSQPGAL